MTQLGEVTFERRFCGPPDSANGGYAAGSLAAFVAEPVVEVRLAAPPPLERPLEVYSAGDELVELRDGADILAMARPGTLDLDVPLPVDYDASVTARARKLAEWDPDTHPFPTCFGCGHLREHGDALLHFCGPVARRDDGVLACPMTTDPQLPHGSDGMLDLPVVWAALDCPSGWAGVPQGTVPHVLGTFTARLDKPVRAGDPHVVMSWPLGEDGRKRYSASAILDAGGAVCALAAAVWIALVPA